MSSITIAAVGDISFEGKNAEQPDEDAFARIASWINKADIRVGNLENPLILSGAPIPGKCTLHGHPGWAAILKSCGFTVMSLANNHMMDYGRSGLESTMRALESAGIAYVGAGMDENEALAPIIIEVQNHKIAIFARSSVEVSSQCYAKGSQCGVAWFDLDEISKSASKIKKSVDYVVLIVHWGLEEYCYPTVRQRENARRLIDAGIDCIIGHHPHVLQGYETIKDSFVIYSLGNFLFDEFEWKYAGADGNEIVLQAKMKEGNKGGVMLAVALENGKVMVEDYAFTSILDGKNVDFSGTSRDNERFKRLNRPFTYPFYKYFWKFYSLKKEWDLRIGQQLSLRDKLKKIHKLKPAHLRNLFKTISKAIKIASGKTTNPYD